MSQEPYEPQQPAPPLPQKSKSNVNGCLIGCLIVFVIGVIGVGLLMYSTYKGLQMAVNEMTEAEPRELPALDISDEERAAASEKIDRFQAAMQGQNEDKEFSFTGQEINVLLRSNPEAAVFGDAVYVTIANDELRGEVSLNLGNIPVVSMIASGRYLNGSAVFDVYTQDNRLFVFIDSFQMKGEDPPPEMIDQLRTQNLAQEFANDPQFKEWMTKIESIDVTGDKLVVKLK